MNKEIDGLIGLLKDEIQNKFGKRISYATDCQVLSEQIQNATQRQLSVSTLKRVFGIIKSTFDPSKYTLDTLAIYLQFNNWDEFVHNFEKEKRRISQTETWDSLKARALAISSKSIKSIKNKIGTRFENFPIRKFAENKFEEFLGSAKIATALVAPDGFGKSTIVTQLTETFFTGKNAKYPNDIVCLVDGSILYNLIINNQEVNKLYNLIEYNPLKSFGAAFRNKPELAEGRFVLIIEGVDDIYLEDEKIDYFIDNLLNMILSYENVGWFKLLITCSPNKWRMFSNRIKGNQILKSLWFDVKYQGTDDEIINIPPLEKKEINAILKKNKFPESLVSLCFYQPDLLDIIKNSYLLHLFLTSHENDLTIRDIDLLNLYIKNTVFSKPFEEEKYLIIKTFFALCEYGKNGSEVKKIDLNLSSTMIIAYNELIRKRILYEYTVHDSYLSLITFVKFSENSFFAYYLANILIKKNELNIDFLKNILDEYCHTPEVRCDIIKYILKILFKEEQIDTLRNVFSILDRENSQENTSNSNMPCYILANVLGVEVRKNRKLRETLIPWYAKSKMGSKLFFETYFDMDSIALHSGNDLDYYLRFNQSDEVKQYVNYMKFMQYFLSGNKELCRVEYENCLNLKSSERNLLNISFRFIPQIIYQSAIERKLVEDILEEVYAESDRLLQMGIQNRIGPPQFEYEIIFALNFGKMNTEIIALSHNIFKNYDLAGLKSTCFYQLFLSIYALALLETGKSKKALELYEHVKIKNILFPEHMKFYIQLRLLLIKTEFLIYKGKTEKARLKLIKIKKIAKFLNFNYFYNRAIEIEQCILNKYKILK